MESGNKRRFKNAPQLTSKNVILTVMAISSSAKIKAEYTQANSELETIFAILKNI